MDITSEYRKHKLNDFVQLTNTVCVFIKESQSEATDNEIFFLHGPIRTGHSWACGVLQPLRPANGHVGRHRLHGEPHGSCRAKASWTRCFRRWRPVSAIRRYRVYFNRNRHRRSNCDTVNERMATGNSTSMLCGWWRIGRIVEQHHGNTSIQKILVNW